VSRRSNGKPKEKKVHPFFEILEDYCIDIENRTIYLVGDIVPEIVESVVHQIQYLSSKTYFKTKYKNPIKLVINSPGGYDDMMLQLYDTLVLCPAPIVTIGTGMVCSAASLILVSGDKRYATPNCMFMTHKGRAHLSGDDDEIQAQAELNKKLSQRYWKLLGRHTKHSAQWWYDRSKGEGELWLDADDMIKRGVIDGIIPSARRELTPLSKRSVKTRVRPEEDLDLDDEDSECEE
jgi:ATP-dependent Clp protease protease subunit